MKKFLAMALALLMVAVLLPVVAMAAGPLQEQIDAAIDGEIITLDQDYTENIIINKKITLNLNGKTLTNAGGNTITVQNGGNLTVTGNGTVNNVTHGKAALSVEEGGKANLNGGTFDRSQENGQNASTAGGNSYYTIINHGELVINEGTTVTTASGDTTLGRYSSLIENGYQSHGGSTNYPTLTINGGSFIGGINTIKNDDNGITTINGGSSTNYYQSSVMNHHKMIINDGSFTGGESAWSVLNCGVCGSIDSTHDAHELIIVNGTFNGDVLANVGKVQIEGGSFDASFTKGANATIEITGGTFTNTDSIKNYLADGKVIRNGKVVDNTIVIIVPDNDNTTTTTTEKPANPATGANDFVGVAAALAVVSLLGMAVASRKK